MNQIYPQCLLTLIVFACSLSITSAVDAQVNGNGVSDSSLFGVVINLPGDPAIGDGSGVGGIAGQTTQLNVSSGGSVGSVFTAGLGSEVNLSGGVIGTNFSAQSSEVNISGGTIEGVLNAAGSMVNMSGGAIIRPGFGLRAQALSEINLSGGFIEGNLFAIGSTANVTGGSLGGLFHVIGGLSTANISGGNFGTVLFARSAGEVNITGGNFGLFQPDSPFPATMPTTLIAAAGGTLNISGGIFEGNLLNANVGGEVNLVGSEFFVDGVRLDPLLLDQPFLVPDRDVTLSGTFQDGSPFDFFLSTTDDTPTESTVTVSIAAVPEPGGLVLLLAGGVVGLLVRRRK